MATSAVAGYKGVLAASTADGGSVIELAEMREFTITSDMSEIDATSHQSSGHREVIPGTGSWTATAEYLQVMASTLHKGFFDLLQAKTLFDAEFYPTGSSSDGYYSGDVYVNSWELASPNEDALLANVGFVGTGALTRSSSST